MVNGDQNIKHMLQSGEELKEGEYLASMNKAYYAVVQGDGNFVVYVSHVFHRFNAIWNSKTGSKPQYVGPFKLILQHDANLVLYDDYNRALWSTGTTAVGVRPHRLIMQDDGNLVLYDKNGGLLWATGTGRNR